MEKRIFDVLTECATGERFDGIILQDEEYRERQGEADKMLVRMEEYCPTEEGKQIVEELAGANSSLGLCYIKLAYQQGFKDCASLLSEIGLAK